MLLSPSFFKNFLSIIFFASSFFAVTSYAYIPPLSSITSKTVSTRSKSAYTIKQEVSFYHSNTELQVQETWTVLNGLNMLLQVQGLGSLKKKISFTYLYKNGQRQFLTSNLKINSKTLGSNWFESYFHYKSSQKMRNRMLLHKMISEDAVYKEVPPKNLKEISYKKPRFIDFDRLEDSVCYSVGKNFSDKEKSRIWIDKNNYYILKIRLPSSVEIFANEYKSYAKNLWLPKKRQIYVSGIKYKMQITQFSRLSLSKAKKLLQTKSLYKKAKVKHSQDKMIQNFYETFR